MPCSIGWVRLPACTFAVLAFLRYAAVKEPDAPPDQQTTASAFATGLRGHIRSSCSNLAVLRSDWPPVCLSHSLHPTCMDAFLLCEKIVYHPLQSNARPNFAKYQMSKRFFISCRAPRPA